jgi:hypothetical protein
MTRMAATLGILANPVLTARPLSQSVGAGGSVTLSAAVLKSCAPLICRSIWPAPTLRTP